MTNPQTEQEKGRVAVWLAPDDIRWLAKHLAQQPAEDVHTSERLTKLRFRLLTALHKAGEDTNIWNE